MTTTYDPRHPQYYDETDLREELERAYDICHGCRLCFNLCPAFPTLFDFIDDRDGDVPGMTEAEQDQVVDECYQCKLCYVKCPYIPPHEWMLDFPRLMMRADAVRKKHAASLRAKLSDQVLCRTDLVGKLSTSAAGLANRATGKPGSLPRRLMEKTLGIASERLLPPYAKERFTTWFNKRQAPPLDAPQGSVAVFPTCLVEYQNPAVGRDLVKVFEHNRIECSLPDGARCCGAPWLHAGDIEHFQKQAEHNVEVLAREVRRGRDIVVSQPTCGYVLKHDYPLYVEGDDAELVGEHSFDAGEYLMRLDRDDDKELDREFGGAVPETVTYHVACHLQAQNVGLKSRDLMKIAGSEVKLVNKCSGIDGMWGYRAENYELSKEVGRKLGDAIESAEGEVVVGDCHLANGGVEEETGSRPQHPLQFLARAYGIGEDDK